MEARVGVCPASVGEHLEEEQEEGSGGPGPRPELWLLGPPQRACVSVLRREPWRTAWRRPV